MLVAAHRAVRCAGLVGVLVDALEPRLLHWEEDWAHEVRPAVRCGSVVRPRGEDLAERSDHLGELVGAEPQDALPVADRVGRRVGSVPLEVGAATPRCAQRTRPALARHPARYGADDADGPAPRRSPAHADYLVIGTTSGTGQTLNRRRVPGRRPDDGTGGGAAAGQPRCAHGRKPPPAVGDRPAYPACGRPLHPPGGVPAAFRQLLLRAGPAARLRRHRPLPPRHAGRNPTRTPRTTPPTRSRRRSPGGSRSDICAARGSRALMT
ncbi:MAG: hypothetical protein V7646_8027 [Pseudonocardia sp.]